MSRFLGFFKKLPDGRYQYLGNTETDSASADYASRLASHRRLASGILLAHECLAGLPVGPDREAALRNFIRSIDALKDAADDLAKEIAWNAMTE